MNEWKKLDIKNMPTNDLSEESRDKYEIEYYSMVK